MDVTVPTYLRPRPIHPTGMGVVAGVEPAIRVRDLFKVYREEDVETVALRGVDLEISPGEFVAVQGRSGSGKSTLLHLLAGSDRPTAGQITVEGIDLARATETERAKLRGRTIGIVYQRQNLVPFLDLLENVQLAAALAERPLDDLSARAMLTQVGLDERRHHRPERLSGGEQQRAALATVVATRPSILLADEITGELDAATAEGVLDLLEAVRAVGSLTIVLVTHDPAVARRADRIVELSDGRVIADRSST